MRLVIAEDTVLLREGLAGCSRTRDTTSSPASATPSRCLQPSPSTSPTSRSSTCACRRPTRTRGCVLRSRFADSIPAPRARSLPARRDPQRSDARRAPAAASATSSRTASSTSTTSSTRSSASRGRLGARPRGRQAALLARRRRRPLAELTPREREVLGLMAEGNTNAGIAEHLWLTEKTVETHVSSILGKLGLPFDG